jgi:hypothetical protein
VARDDVLRAESVDPFARWSLGARGPVRETPEVRAMLVTPPGGDDTYVHLDAGVFDPREPQHERSLTLLRELELLLER